MSSNDDEIDYNNSHPLPIQEIAQHSLNLVGKLTLYRNEPISIPGTRDQLTISQTYQFDIKSAEPIVLIDNDAAAWSTDSTAFTNPGFTEIDNGVEQNIYQFQRIAPPVLLGQVEDTLYESALECNETSILLSPVKLEDSSSDELCVAQEPIDHDLDHEEIVEIFDFYKSASANAFDLSETSLVSDRSEDQKSNSSTMALNVKNKVTPMNASGSRTRLQATPKAGSAIFNVARVKKVELNEMPTLTKKNGNVSDNNSNNVLRKVASLTAGANSSDSRQSNRKPVIVPEKLSFAAYEKFEGKCGALKPIYQFGE